MIYIGEQDIKSLNKDWNQDIQVIAKATQCLLNKDSAQPIKPYLRYGDIKNRIIAMPAFVGGEINMSGIKWIASFPDNIRKGIPRAHCVVVLNDAKTGLPIGIVNSGSISAIRTAAVSGFMIQQFVKHRNFNKLKIGITGFGPIGQHHLNMCVDLLGDAIEKVFIYDLADIRQDNITPRIRSKVQIAESWEQAYEDADIFMTCTVSKDRYIDKKPKPGSLHLNVSLRDYKADVFPWFAKAIIVDDWEEVCRENTDIELFSKTKGLTKEDVMLLHNISTANFWSKIDNTQPVMFNPMGMAVFDIATASHYLQLAQKTGKCVHLN